MTSMINKPKVLVTRKLPDEVEIRLSGPFDVTLNLTDTPLSQAELYTAMSEFDGLIPTVSDPLTADILGKPDSRVKVIANVGVGYSNIDINAARAAGIRVSNTPDVLTDATADIAMLLILSATRGAYAAEQTLRNNRWAGFSIVDGLGTSIQNKVLGIIGMGRIGRATAKRAVLGFGMKVVFFNRSPVKGLEFDAEAMTSIEELMRVSDVVSLHVPGGSHPVVKAEHIACMKSSAYLVNTARGDSIDQDALIQALANNRIRGAGLDVYDGEPAVPELLKNMQNVTLLPHVGSATEEVRRAMGMLAVDNIEAFFAGHSLPNQVV